jgi:type I restriction enzyme, S subunit
MDKLPKGWKHKTVGDVLEKIMTGTTPPMKELKYYQNPSINWYSPSDFNDDIKTLSKPTRKLDKTAIVEGKAKLFNENSLLLVAIGATVGKIGLIKERSCSNQQITAIEFKQNVFPDFSYYWFKYIKPEIVKNASAATLPIINQNGIKQLPFILPPLPDQTRIVSKLNALFARIDKSIALLAENIKHTKGLMASVLEELFEKLEAESTIYKIKEIAEIKGGKRLPKGESIQDEKTDYPYIRVTDFTDDGTIDVNSVKYMTGSVQEQIKRYIITSKDLYISIAGTIGKTGIIPKELENANLTENAARLVFKSNIKINNRFIYYFTLSDNFKDQVGLATKTVAQPKMALTRLAEVELPIPSIEVQNKEVQIFDKLSRKFQEINNQQLSKLTYLKALKSSLLDRAFKGEL